MKNFLSKLWSLSRTDRVRTLAIDAVSLPSFCRVNMLKLVSVFALLLTIGVGNAWADYTIVFKDGSGTSSIDASTLSNFINSGASYVTSASSSYMYPSATDGYGIRLASSNYAGNLTLNLSATGQIKASKITFNAAYYGTDASTMPYTITYTDNTTTTDTISTLSTSLADKEVSLTSTKTIKTIYIGTTAKKKRVYVHSITVTAAAAATPSITPDPTSLSWGTVLQGSSQSTKTISITGANLTAGTLTISATGGYSVTPTSKSVSGTLAATTLTVTPPSTATTGSKNGKVTISGGGLASAVEVNLSMTVNAASTVTWMNNGSEYTTTLVANGSKPEFPDDPSSCDGTSTTFVGWTPTPWSGKLDDVSAKTIYTSGSAMPNVSGPVTYHAVFAKASSGGGGEPTEKFSVNVQAAVGDISLPSGYSLSQATEWKSSTHRQDGSNDPAYIKIYHTSTKLFSSLPAAITIKAELYGGTARDMTSDGSSYYPYVFFTDNAGAEIAGSAKAICTSVTNSAAEKSVSMTVSDATNAYGIGIRHAKISGFNLRYSSITLEYAEDATTYSEYLTTCCTNPGLNYGTGSVTKTYGEGVFTNTLTNSHSVAVTYSSSDPTVATVNGSGQVTILKAGSTTITASSVAQTVAAVSYCADEASYTLTVNKANISPSLSYSSTTLVIGNNSSSPTVGGNSGSGTVTYAITTESTSGVVTLNTSTGVVTAAKEGTATITATIPATTNYNGGSATANFTVTCGAPSSVDISGNYQFYPGETISLTATPTGGAGTPVTYQWKKDGVNIVGATSATYTKDDATVSDAGSYTCTVQYGSNCATTSDAFKLKCMQFYLKTSGGADISNHALTKVDATHATLSLSLTSGTTYKFRVTDGCGDWYGNTGEMTSSNCTNWAMDADADCRVTTSSKSATYVFNFDFSGGLLGSEMKVTVVYPSSNQASGKVIYWDNEVNKWNGSKLWYRIGKSTHNSNTQLSKVAGTANFYSVTTSQYDGFEYWHIANNQGQGTGNIFWTKDNSGSGLEITNAMGFEGAPITDATATVTPTTTHSTGGSSDNNNCEFYTYSITSGIKSYTVTSSATNCTVAMEKYNNDAGSSTTALASGGTVMPTQYVKVTVTPNTGYQFSSVSVTNGTTVTAAAAGTPGVYYITGNATVTATCTVKSCTVNFDKNSGTGGDASTTATYGSAMTTVTAPTRTGYTFDGYWDAETDNDGSGTQYYLANGTSARDWDKDVTAAQTLYAKWNAKQYTIELDREGAATGATSVTATYDAGTLAGWSVPSKTGYTFGGYWSGDNGTGTLVISTTGVLQNSVTISAVAWTDGSGHWVKDGGATVYAKWTANVYNITYKDQDDVAYSGNATAGVPTGAPTTHTYGSATALVDGVKDGYRFDGWFTDASCTVSAGSSIGATAKTADFTLYAKWTQVYTVTWSVNGETWSSGVVEGNTHVPGGSKVSALPTAPTSSDCDDAKVFMGWRASEIDGTSVSDPGGIFTTQAGSPTISADKTFYAVFADEDGGDFTRVTNVASQISAGKKVIMGYEATPNSGVIVPLQSNALNGTLLYTGTTEGSAGSGTLTMSSMSSGDEAIYAFTIRAGHNSGYWAFEMSGDNEGKYLSHNGKNSITNAESVTNDGKTDFSIVLGTNDVATITNKYGNENTTQDGKNYYNYKIFCYNYNNGNPRAAIYRATQTGDFVMYLCNPLTYSNYVTSCSSCDADATFTNTTPAVSDIDCTSAMLTATGGLATVGADGCHVSDYGFVIGTADNPAIGGSGVTKLQVGTSDPTIGEDFSYDATGLTKGTHYYIRAYAINRHGTAYSSSTNFWTKGVSSIAITTAPTKTKYVEGETFDKTGMVVTATMADGSTEDVTSDCTFSPSLSTKLSDQTAVRATYSLCDVDKTADQAINVYTLTVTEGTNDTYGTAGKTDNKVTVTGLGDHKTYTVTVTSGNADKIDNGDGTYTITNATGNVTVRVDYADAVQVKVYYKVDGVTVTGLTQDVYQSETTTLPTASELATAMTAQSMDIPDDDYPNFIGWSETEFPAQTAEPTIVTGTPTINAEKTYYAVYTNLSKITIIPSDFSTSYPSSGSADGTKTFGGKRFGWNYLLNGNVSKTNLPLQFKKNSTEYGRLYNTDPLNYILRVEIGYYNEASAVPVYVASSAGTISGGALTPASRESTDPYVYTMPASTSYFYIKGDNNTVYKIRSVDIYYSPATIYYMTQFCTNRVTLTQNSPEHGTVEFGRSSLVTCGSDKNVSLTIIPDVGYQLTGWTVNTSSGYADAKTTSPAVVTNSNNSAAQNITLTFAEDANKDYDVTATFGLMTVTSWAWTLNSAAIPDPLNLYVGQSARLDVAYTPAGVDNSKKTYTRTKEDAYINWVGGAYATYSTISGKASTGESTTEVTFTHADGPTTTVNVKVLPLPAVHFGDIVHNVSFDDVVATLSDNTLSPTKTTPTHADFDGSTANTCEEQHLHLVGWIREDWPALVAYLNGTGDAPSTEAIVGAGNDGSGNAYFFEPGASINTQTFNGVTFYAVWAKVE